MQQKINLFEKLSIFSSYWDPKIIGALNGQHVKLVKFQGEFVWHKHDREDELFLVLQGSFDMQFRDQIVSLEEGECIIVPKGIEHCPRAEKETHVLLFEPAGTINTGEYIGQETVANQQKI